MKQGETLHNSFLVKVKKKKRRVKEALSRIRHGRAAEGDETPLTLQETDGRSIEVLPGDPGWISDDPEVTQIQTPKPEKKKKKKKKFSKKKIRRKTWKAMKSSWKYLKGGLVMMANTSVGWSLTGTVNTMVQDYYQHKNYNSYSTSYTTYAGMSPFG